MQSDGVDISSSGNHDFKHYRLSKDVVLRLEYISAAQTKACNPAPVISGFVYSGVPRLAGGNINTEYRAYG